MHTLYVRKNQNKNCMTSGGTNPFLFSILTIFYSQLKLCDTWIKFGGESWPAPLAGKTQTNTHSRLPQGPSAVTASFPCICLLYFFLTHPISFCGDFLSPHWHMHLKGGFNLYDLDLLQQFAATL